MAPTRLSPLKSGVYSFPARAPRPRLDWQTKLAACIEQDPLIERRASLAGLRHCKHRPNTALLGIGVCAPTTMSRGVPLDLLGVVLPAESIRRAAGADELILLIADSHAEASGHAPALVETQANAIAAALDRLRAVCRLDAIRTVYASSYSSSAQYRSILAHVRRVTPPGSEYVQRQLADILFWQGQRQHLLKVGWALPQSPLGGRRDEVAFDRALYKAGGRDVGFAYCRPARALNDRAPRVSPYVVRNPAHRLLLTPTDDARDKLAAASELVAPQTLQGFARHLRLLLYTFGKFADPVRGEPLAGRADSLLRRLAPELPPPAHDPIQSV